jgi:hypothetical protein
MRQVRGLLPTPYRLSVPKGSREVGDETVYDLTRVLGCYMLRWIPGRKAVQVSPFYTSGALGAFKSKLSCFDYSTGRAICQIGSPQQPSPFTGSDPAPHAALNNDTLAYSHGRLCCDHGQAAMQLAQSLRPSSVRIHQGEKYAPVMTAPAARPRMLQITGLPLSVRSLPDQSIRRVNQRTSVLLRESVGRRLSSHSCRERRDASLRPSPNLRTRALVGVTDQ